VASTGVTPSSVTIAVGQSVTFSNVDAVAHDIQPNPGQPAGCAQVGAVASVPSGQQKLTNAFTAPVTCGYYDYGAPMDQRFQGTITVQ
jgi:plastocyanin